MAEIKQETRPIRAAIGSLDANAFLLTEVEGEEGISHPFEFTIGLAVPEAEPLDFSKVLGQAALIELDGPEGRKRFIRGIIRRLSQGKRADHFVTYHAELVPNLWLLTKNIRSRIFQQKAVKEIISDVIGKLHTVEFKLHNKYFTRNYCVQYRESDLDFIHRLMEEEGIFYFFTQDDKETKLIITDADQDHPDLPPEKKMRYEDDIHSEGQMPEVITSWIKSQELRAGGFSVSDHTFEMPGNPLDVVAPAQDTSKAGTVFHDLSVGDMANFVTVEHPGDYAHWRDGVAPGGADRAKDLQDVFDDVHRIGTIRVEQIVAKSMEITGTCNTARVMPGYAIELNTHPDADGPYVLTWVWHKASCGASTSGEAVTLSYENQFWAVPKDIVCRPQRTTAKPFIRGTQTAVVVGDDAEIDPDKYGRVKVWFRWNPEGMKGLDTSCWVRVAQFWAGRQWGAQFIPRVGDEVVVAFEEGDPDKPIIIGSVYNADNMPMYDLPLNKTVSGIKTHSSPGGDDENYNEIKFEDKKGHEMITIHAENCMTTFVENSHTINVGSTSSNSGSDTTKTGKLTQTVYGDTILTVTKGNYTREISAGTSTTHVKGNVKEDYDATQTTTVKNGQLTDITGGNHVVTVDAGLSTIKSSAEQYYDSGSFIQVTAKNKILLKTGSSSIEMLSDGTINILGVKITINGSTFVHVDGGGATGKFEANKAVINGSSGVDVTGGPILISGAKVDIKGTPVAVNC